MSGSSCLPSVYCVVQGSRIDYGATYYACYITQAVVAELPGFELSCDWESTLNLKLIQEPQTTLLWTNAMFSADSEC